MFPFLLSGLEPPLYCVAHSYFMGHSALSPTGLGPASGREGLRPFAQPSLHLLTFLSPSPFIYSFLLYLTWLLVHRWGPILSRDTRHVQDIVYALTCMKNIPCRVIYLSYLVHISHNLFPSCCQRCTTQIVPTMCYHTRNYYFLFIY